MSLVIKAQSRNKSEKVKKLKAGGFIPGCLYSKGMDTTAIKMDSRDLAKVTGSNAGKVTLHVDGKEYLAGVDEVQRDVVTGDFQHVSFRVLNKDEKANLSVEIKLVGKSKGEASGGMINQILHEVTVRGYPHQIPNCLDLDTTSLEVGDVLRVQDIPTANFEFLADDMERVIVKCQHANVLDLGTTESEKGEDPVAQEEGAETPPADDATTTEPVADDDKESA